MNPTPPDPATTNPNRGNAGVPASGLGSGEGSADLLERATRRDSSPFDYLIVGSGAGGGPLACRLALAGKRVLLIEAGQDPRAAGEAHDVPGYNAAATEHPELSWEYSVRHYADTGRQRTDHKYDAARDPDGTGGIFYPRSSGIGGCTGHHAMIVLRPNGRDWDDIAELTGDDSWRSGRMLRYFERLERCLYFDGVRGFLGTLLKWGMAIWEMLIRIFRPSAFGSARGHGLEGWQPTGFIGPELVRRIMATDPTLTGLLLNSMFTAIEKVGGVGATLRRFFLTLGIFRSLDPNDLGGRMSLGRGGIFLIPAGIGGTEGRDERGESLKGRRSGLREFILKTRAAHPDRLVLATGVHVRRVLFDDTQSPPRAVGVLVSKGDHLYRASPLNRASRGVDAEYYVRSGRAGAGGATGGEVGPAGEVILCAGSFNSPQLLMLSGIGDAAHLEELNGRAPAGERIPVRVHLPGVGRNLQDRYEITVLSELSSELRSLKGVSFTPGDPADPVRAEWLAKREGLYATNGGSLAILQRSAAADRPEPDLFAFGGPAAFRGYYWNWSKELLKATKGAAQEQRNLWTWVILKAYARNNAGTVRLRSPDPFEPPAICFHSFDEGGVKDWEKDVEALVEAVESMRAISAVPGSPFVREVQPEGYLAERNEQRRLAGLPPWTLRDWIKNEAWGHHACGTCRIGRDAWKANPAELGDRHAVLDSRFRVHGVAGLRVVDASVFPKIPGYFLLAPIFMVSEKAADVLLGIEDPENGGGTATARGPNAR